MKKEHLFVYGTLLDDTKREEIIGRQVPAVPDTLPDFVEMSVEVNSLSYRCAEASEGSKVLGMRLELGREELEKVDTYETDAYDRKRVKLASGATAWVYVKN